MAVSTRGAAVGLMALLAVLIVVFLFAAPRMMGGGSGSEAASSTALLAQSTGSSGGSLQQARRISKLEHEIEQLKEAIAQEQEGRSAGLFPSNPSSNPATSVTIDLMGLLGLQSFFAGVSWDPYHCAPPYKAVWKDIDDATLARITDKLAAELRTELAQMKNVPIQDIDPNKLYHEQGLSAEAAALPEALEVYSTDPVFRRWRSRLMTLLAKYMPRADGATLLHDACEKQKGKLFKPDDFGTAATDCSDAMSEEAINEALGYYALPQDSVALIASNLITVGHCMGQVRNHQPSYAHWLRKERMFIPDWMTFAVETPEQDAVVLLFDILYEKLGIFTRQYWLGVITMQNPFDMYSIQDIIFVSKPTLLIETGTANGGSALLWASIMHLADIPGQIVTIDVNKPKWEGDNWGGRAREDPTQHRLWKKHVTFVQGGSVDDSTYETVKSMAVDKKVMVLLDSHHSEYHVSQEMERYCPLVSVGCYCIIEDTKMSRWSSNGPLESVKKFMAGKHGKDFFVDRSRELLYSHHTMGYLKRVTAS